MMPKMFSFLNKNKGALFFSKAFSKLKGEKNELLCQIPSGVFCAAVFLI